MLRYGQNAPLIMLCFILFNVQYKQTIVKIKEKIEKRKHILVQLPYLDNVFVKLREKLQIQLPRYKLYLKKYGYSGRFFRQKEKNQDQFCCYCRSSRSSINSSITLFFFQGKEMTKGQEFAQTTKRKHRLSHICFSSHVPENEELFRHFCPQGIYDH